MATLRIGEVAERSGIAASALRYYERGGLLPRADRREAVAATAHESDR